MAAIITTKALLKLILQACQEYGHGDPITILDIGNVPWYKNNINGRVPQPPYTDRQFEAVRLVKRGYTEKPGRDTSLGQIKVKYYTWVNSGEKQISISVHDAAAAMHDYAFRPEYNVNADTDADMLLTGEPEHINFRYFLLRNAQLKHAPHLFAGNSPLLLLATVLQQTHTVQTLLEHSGFLFTSTIQARISALLQDLETKNGGTGYAQVFEQLQQEMKNRWHSTNVKDYAGYRAEGTYNRVCYTKDR